MIEPVGRFEQRRSASDFGIGDPHPVRGGAEVNFLTRPRRKRRRRSAARRGPRNRFRGQRCRLAHRADEADAFARYRSDQGLRLAAVADCFAHRVDPAGQGRFRYDAAAPNRPQEVVLADHPLPVPDEVDQEIEDLGFKRNQPGAAPQLTALDVERIIPEQKRHLGAPHGGSASRNNQGSRKDKSRVGQSPSTICRASCGDQRDESGGSGSNDRPRTKGRPPWPDSWRFYTGLPPISYSSSPSFTPSDSSPASWYR